MTDVNRLLEEFIAEDRAGGVADPARLPGARRRARPRGARGADRRLPGPRAAARVRPRGVRGLPGARGVAASLARLVAATWPALLPRLRDRARLRRAELVARLAAELGVGGREAKVARLLPRDGAGNAARRRGSATACSRRSGGSSARARRSLRAAGAAMTRRRHRRRRPRVRARRLTGAASSLAPAAAAGGSAPPPAERDEVDELFTGR